MAPPKPQHCTYPTHCIPSQSTVSAPALPLDYKSMAKCSPNTTTSSTDKRHSSLELAEQFLQFPETQETTMMSAKNLAQLAKKWQRVVAMGRKRLTSSTSGEETGGPCGTSCSPVAGKGHFVVYTTDGARFEVPLAFLGTTVFDELLRMSQEEFGFTGVDGGRITLPCDASMMEYAMCLLRRNASSEMEAAFLNTMAMPCHYHAEPHLGVSQHYGVCSS
ncbi:auxin-responsive protein SAUR36-like [Triticum aestivum]|uniref:auxin-responsive protein SAUR36-like n=1 Tax=Triticum aestivum TaxID=4565 RepID=UPI001D01AF7D|nr:auxin-responsive protein SAUR36-like [Triticum aestivum]